LDGSVALHDAMEQKGGENLDDKRAKGAAARRLISRRNVDSAQKSLDKTITQKKCQR